MSTIDQQFVEYIIKSLVEHPDDVVVERLIDEKGVLLTLTVSVSNTPFSSIKRSTMTSSGCPTSAFTTYSTNC